MFKKISTLVALAITVAAIATASSPLSSRIASLVSQQKPLTTVAEAEVQTVASAQTQVQEATPVQAVSAVDQEAFNAEALQTLVDLSGAPNWQSIKTSDYVPTMPELTSERVQMADAAIMASVSKKSQSKSARKVGTVKVGSIVEMDHTTSSNYGNSAVIAQIDSEDASKGYELTNFYNLGDTIALQFTVDAENGTVSIPRQVLYTSSSVGDFSFVGIVTKDGTRYMSSDPVTGTIDEDGNISFGSWGIIVTTQTSSYYGRGLIIASSSDWKQPNATVEGINASSGAKLNYGIYIDQTGENSVSLYGFTNVIGSSVNSVLNGRVYSSKSIQIPTQTVFTNSYYGDFANYAVAWSYDADQEAWKYSIDKTNPMKFTTVSDNVLSLPGWMVGLKEYASQYAAGYYRDFTLTLKSGAITWPEAAKLSYSGAGTSADPYLIKTASDVTALSKLVSEGNAFDNTYFAMANDIDMSSVDASNYIAIGDGSAPFNGTFDGKGYTIKNLTVKGGSFDYTGIFGCIGADATVKNLNVDTFKGYSDGAYLGAIAGYSYGVIDNCNVTNSALDSNGQCAAGIVGLANYGTNRTNTAITNCSFVGTVTASGSGAGIVGQGACNIENCYVKAVIVTDSYVTSCFDCAGIAGVLTNGSLKNCWSTGLLSEQYGRSSTGGLVGRCLSSTIENSFTTAAIQTKRSYTDSNGGGDNYTGGLVGYSYASVINNCYSSSSIYKTGTSDYCGGIIGYLAVGYATSSGSSTTVMKNNSKVTNCYFSGSIYSSSSEATKGMYGSTFLMSSWTGETPDALCFTNCYYDQQVNLFGEDTYGRNTSFFINGLPSGFSSDVWEAKQGYYPVLKTTGAGTQAQALSSTPLVLQDGQTAKKVKVSFTVNPVDNVTWSINGAENNETTSLKQDGNTFTVKDIYDDARIDAVSADGLALKYYFLSVVPKVFDGEGTAESPYLIKSVTDLINLDAAVSEHAQAHVGDYFKMTNDIDCSNSDFQGVGHGSSYAFGGTFDGCGYSIKNLSIDNVRLNDDGKATSAVSISYGGLFNFVNAKGTIKNVVIDKSCKFNFSTYSGPVVGVSYGVIDNCRNYADVTGVFSYVGGIAGYNYGGTISNCYNAGRISAGGSFSAGIVSFNTADSKITMCQNDGDVIAESNHDTNATTVQTTLGGIVSYNYGAVELSVNNGQVSADNTVGGIAGRNAGGDITGCLDNGLVLATGATAYRGAIIGYQQSNGTIANNYYDSSINVNGASNNVDIDGVTACSTSELVAGVCPAELKTLGADEVFDFTANSYPVLKAFASETAAKSLRTMYVGFGAGQVRNNVTGDVELSPVEGAEWSLSVKKNFNIDGKKLTVTTPTDNSVANDTLTVSLNGMSKVYPLTSVPVIFKGNGTAESPFLLETPADWNKLADFVEASNWEYSGQYFKVANDLDFEGDSIRVIAHDGVNFQGVLDGAGHTVKNYIYSNTNSVKTKLSGANLYVGKFIGLFGNLGSFGVIKNLTIDGQFEAYQQIGALVGYSYGKIENVVHKGKVSNTSGTCVGGIAFRVYTGGSITDCVNEGTVVAKTTSACGICYEAQVGTTLERCYNRGTVQSTTTMPCGIAYKVSGGLVDCGNEKSLVGTGSLTGIAYTMDSTAYAVRCYNIAPLGDATKATVCGLFNTFTARKAPATTESGYVEDCYNTGAITAKDYGYGFANKVNAGWRVSRCYNTGDVTSEALACGLFNAMAGAQNIISTIDHSYNTGNITGKKAAVAGLASDGSNYTKWDYCYNTGEVVNNLANGLTTAGLVAKLNGKMDHCYNTGNVTSKCNATGGLVGYVSYGKDDYTGSISNSFNLGDVTCTGFTGAGTQGNAGGLAGYIATSSAAYWVELDGCFNAGNVTSDMRVGGLVGGLFTSYPVVKNCYNSGKVTSELQSDNKYWQSGTVFSNNETQTIDNVVVSMYRNVVNCYYDKTVTTTANYYENPAKALTTSELKAATISDSFEASECGGYPVLKGFDDYSANQAGGVMILVTNESEENFDSVTSPITLVAPAGTTWAVYEADGTTTSTKMTVDGTKATPAAKGDVVLVATTAYNYSRRFILTLDPAADAVNSVNADKDIESVIYVDLQGRVVAQPVPGSVYVVRTNYTDGTSSVAKVLAR